jgi:glyoxylase-like metal-dependent hydrolase (beta-lactamase superfamily II)
LTSTLAEQSGAAVGSSTGTADVMATYAEHVAADDEFAAGLMRRHGVAEEIVRSLETAVAPLRAFGASAIVSWRMRDGDEIPLRRHSLDVLSRPGHSPYDTIFYDPNHGVLFAGDHLLAGIPSNALVTRASSTGQGEARSRPLVDYRRSLSITRTLDVRFVAGGHGSIITNHRDLIDKRLRMQDERCEHLLELLAQRPLSAHALARLVWGPVAVAQVFLTLSAVLGHLDLLVADGAVEERDGDPVLFETT